MRWITTLATLLAIGLAGPAIAGVWEDVIAADERGDYAGEIPLLKPLADQGNADAQAILGFMYYTGKGVPQNYVQAVKWYRLAADQGYARAQTNLGFMYDSGQGVPRDYVQAVKWYRLAADQGNARAQTNLGVMYRNGQGVPRDYVLAYMWSNLGAAGGDEIGGNNRDLDASRMTPADISEAQRLSREWKPK